MPIDRTAAQGFSAGAAAYERARPAYPEEAVAALVNRLRIVPGSSVLDIGAGTGKLTGLLLPTGAAVYAAEPVASMRSVMAGSMPAVRVVGATAEAVPFADGSFDAVVVAQAFHWFDGPVALAEVHRIVRPGGGLGLVWNVRDHSTPWVGEMSRIVDEYGDAIRRHESGEWRVAFDGRRDFTPLEVEEFRNVQTVDEAHVLDRVSSTSFIAMMSDSEREKVLNRVREVLASHPDTRGKERFEFPHLTRVYCCDRV
jgi:SAM-dependent methyltransferase